MHGGTSRGGLRRRIKEYKRQNIMELPKFADDDKNNNNVKNQKTETYEPAKSGKSTNITNTNEEKIKKKERNVHIKKEVINKRNELKRK